MTNYAISQMIATVYYISQQKGMPDTARKWSEKIKKGISRLTDESSVHKLVDFEPWKSRGVRVLQIENYLAYHWINKKTNTTWVIALVYNRKDQQSELEKIVDYEE